MDHHVDYHEQPERRHHTDDVYSGEHLPQWLPTMRARWHFFVRKSYKRDGTSVRFPRLSLPRKPNAVGCWPLRFCAGTSFDLYQFALSGSDIMIQPHQNDSLPASRPYPTYSKPMMLDHIAPKTAFFVDDMHIFRGRYYCDIRTVQQTRIDPPEPQPPLDIVQFTNCQCKKPSPTPQPHPIGVCHERQSR